MAPPPPSVSLLTITQGSRVPFLHLQKRNMLVQTKLGLVKEWVIVDGNKTKEGSATLQAALDDPAGFSKDMPFKIVRVPYKEGRKLGGHRNAGNAATSCDIIICVDDDDYYQPVYIEHAVQTLAKTKKLIAGCGPIFIYDLHWRTITQLDLITPYSSVNNCFCYKREYLKKFKYDDSKESGEEVEFTRGFQEPLEQMDPRKCIIQIAHNCNTVFKQKLLISGFFDMKIGYTVKTDMDISELIRDNEALDALHAVVGPRKPCAAPETHGGAPYDIVYYCGCMSIEWNPTSTSLGGSEQAVVQLAKEWVKRGKRVVVYGELIFPKEKKRDNNGAPLAIGERKEDLFVSPEGVHYRHFSQFYPWQEFNTLILWRLYGTAPILKMRSGTLKANRVLIDIHDNLPQHYAIIADHLQRFSFQAPTTLMFKSMHHVGCFQSITQMPLYQHQVAIIPNGVQTTVFKTIYSPPPVRNPYRFCYASSYNRGIIPILKNLWPVLLQLEPRAELHIYYGLDKTNPNAQQLVQEFYNALIPSTNVCDHGRQTLEIVAREKQHSTFQLYLCDSHEEIDCISARESLVAGCIPILLDTGVFKERDGFKLQGNVNDANSCAMMAMEIAKLMADHGSVSFMREQLKKSKTIIEWSEVAGKWPV